MEKSSSKMPAMLNSALRTAVEPVGRKGSLSQHRVSTTLQEPIPPQQKASYSAKASWGRRDHHGSWTHSLGCLGMMIFAPSLVIFFIMTLSHFRGSLGSAFMSLLDLGLVQFLTDFSPRITSEGCRVYAVWMLSQVLFYLYLPGKISTGQLTPAGNLLQYRTNGLTAWIVTHALYAVLSIQGFLDPAILAKNWSSLIVVQNICGFLLTGMASIKAHTFPTHKEDRKFSGSILYDMYMGIELNPRIGDWFDFKLFINGRPGIVAWTLIDLSFIAYQFQQFGYVTNSILLATALHTIYVVDFFINEDWYLRTIDIAHDHFGFYLAWGSLVWLPVMYTLQTQYLAVNPVVLDNTYGFIVFFIGVAGYILFRSVNHQKDLARRTNGNCSIWGSPAKLHLVKYMTTDGKEHHSILLCSGWWGMARHVNYLGDLMLSYAMCAACGTTDLLPWFYACFMTLLLIHRCWRDEERCSSKYGQGWEEYCKKVRWVILPGVW